MTKRFMEELVDFNSLPNEIYLIIFDFLPISCQPIFRRTCKRISQIKPTLSQISLEPGTKELATWLLRQSRIIQTLPSKAFFKPVSDPGWTDYGDWIQIVFKFDLSVPKIVFDVRTGEITGHTVSFTFQIKLDSEQAILEFLKGKKMKFNANYSVTILNWLITRDIVYNRTVLQNFGLEHHAFLGLLANKMCKVKDPSLYMWVYKLNDLCQLLTPEAIEGIQVSFVKQFNALSDIVLTSFPSRYNDLSVADLKVERRVIDFNTWLRECILKLKVEDFRKDPRINYDSIGGI